MKDLQAKLTAKYRELLSDLDELIAINDRWHDKHPGDEPIDIETIRVHRRGAALALAAVERGEAIPDEALRMMEQSLA